MLIAIGIGVGCGTSISGIDICKGVESCAFAGGGCNLLNVF